MVGSSHRYLPRYFLQDRGSLAPLGIGLASLALMLVVTVLLAGSLYLTERRLTTAAEFVALGVLERVDARGDINAVAKELLQATPNGFSKLELIRADSPDGLSVRIGLCSSWEPIFGNYMFSEIGKVCSEALARRGR